MSCSIEACKISVMCQVVTNFFPCANFLLFFQPINTHQYRETFFFFSLWTGWVFGRDILGPASAGCGAGSCVGLHPSEGLHWSLSVSYLFVAALLCHFAVLQVFFIVLCTCIHHRVHWVESRKMNYLCVFSIFMIYTWS